MQILKWLNLSLILVNFAGFSWSVLFFFKTRPDQVTASMKQIKILTPVFVTLTLGILFFSQDQNPLFGWIAVVLYLASFTLFWWTIRTCQKLPPYIAFTERPPQGLTVSGPYQIVRHPFYTSYILYWLGGVFCNPGAWALWAGFIIMTLYYIKAARMEESYFSGTKYAKDYERYCQKAGMFWPKIL